MEEIALRLKDVNIELEEAQAKLQVASKRTTLDGGKAVNESKGTENESKDFIDILVQSIIDIGL